MFNIKQKIIRNPIVQKLNWIIWRRIKFWKSKDREYKQLILSKDFFEKNKERVNSIISWFYDEESKRTYLSIIKSRYYGKKAGIFSYHGGENQYFYNNFFKYDKDEVLIDCGAYDGDTIDAFLNIPNIDYKKIIAFEPDSKNFNILENKYRGKDKFMLINAGAYAYSKDCELYFDGQGTGGKVLEIPTKKEGEIRIPVRSIDGLQIKERVTLIKMDIEGAELKALKGAKELILKDKPKLAICIYHSNEDMLQIAEWIHTLVPEYKFYCRQHHPFQQRETVLYAKL